MKRFVALLGLALAAALPSARAQQGPDDQYFAIYTLMQQADALQAGGQPQEALADYTQALASLQKFQKMFPEWDPEIINYRLHYLTDKINGLAAQVPPGAPGVPASTNTPSPAAANATPTAPNAVPVMTNAVSAAPVADLEIELSTLRARVQTLQADNETLQAKLREALRAQPATADALQLTQAQVQVVTLMKENDLLRASLAGATNGSSRTELSKLRRALADANQQLAEQTGRADKLAQENQKLQSAASINALAKAALEEQLRKRQSAAAPKPAAASDELKTLRARLAVDEAQAVPYTPEELALLQTPAPAPVANPGDRTNAAARLSGDLATLVAEAQNYFSAGDYAKAEADYRQVLQHDPNNALVLGNLATIELQENKLADAEKHITAALAQNPDDAYTLATYGNLKLRQRQYDQALDALSRAAKLDPANPQTQNYLGVTLSEKGLRAQAETALRKAVELDPNFAAAQNNLAVVYLSDRPPMPALARWHYQKAIDLGQPRNAELEKKLADLGAPVNQ